MVRSFTPPLSSRISRMMRLTTLAGSVKGSSAEIHSPAMQMRKTTQNSKIRFKIITSIYKSNSQVYPTGLGKSMWETEKERRFFDGFLAEKSPAGRNGLFAPPGSLSGQGLVRGGSSPPDGGQQTGGQEHR